MSLTPAEQLAALGTYLKVLGAQEKALRVRVEQSMGEMHVERVGAYLPDGEKIASVSRSDGNTTVKVVDEDGFLAWTKEEHPEHVYTVEMVRPAYRTFLLDVAGSLPKGSKGLDPTTGRELPFIEVRQGSPYVTVTTTPEGVDRMSALANGFAAMIERPVPKSSQGGE